MMRRNFNVTWVLLLVGQVFAANPVTEYMLDNGMKVVVKEDHRAPVVISQVWYKVGSSYEHSGITGLSHVLEHMMFKGTKDVAPGDFSRIVSALGGSENAFTSADYTAYFETLAVRHLEKALQLEADRMRNLVLDPKEFAKEVEVVKEERRLRTEDKPTGLTYEQFKAVAWRASPYRIPVIGWMSDLDQMTVDDLDTWYKRWYAPNNATLVVAGDVKPEEVLALAQKHFAPITRVDLKPLKESAEPKQRGVTRVVVEVPAKQSYMLMGYKTPIVGTADEDWEPYALYVLSSILDGGNSTRLSRELVREQAIAASAGAGYDTYSRLPDLFLFDGIPTDGHTTAELEQAVRGQIERLQKELVEPAELKRVVTQVIAGKVFQADSLFNQAMEIGMLETYGLSWRLIDRELDMIRAVTPEQVRKVAQKYLIDDNLTVAVLKPLPMSQAKPRKRSALGPRHGG